MGPEASMAGLVFRVFAQGLEKLSISFNARNVKPLKG